MKLTALEREKILQVTMSKTKLLGERVPGMLSLCQNLYDRVMLFWHKLSISLIQSPAAAFLTFFPQYQSYSSMQ